ncbi:MAG TPA: hypothetical protein PL196_08625, partial [Burkholderiaceae bacterium]|nr:hypothetical protein [Burkholderiaceae bacterium]
MSAIPKTVRAVVAAALSTAAVAAVAGPSNHSFAWTHIIGSATLLINGTDTRTATNRGWVDDLGTNNFGGAASNYIAGVCGSSDECSGGDREAHNYFAFDMGAAGTITSAVLTLYQPGPADTGGLHGFLSQYPSLTYSLWDSTLNPTTDSGVGLYTDLGSGINYGSIVLTDASNGTFVSISLNAAAIAALQAAADVRGSAYIGGAIA